jgi:hypothetical protein
MLDQIKNKIMGFLGGGGPQPGQPQPGQQTGELPPPPPSEDEEVGFVDAEYKRRQDERRPYELQNRLNLAFLDGNQYVDIAPGVMDLVEQPELYVWQEKEAFNHIAPNIETRISKLKRVRPILKVKQANRDRKNLHSSRVGTQILKDAEEDQQQRDRYNEELNWMEACGTVLEKKVWNPNLGRFVGYAQDPQTGEQKAVYEGDMETIVVPPQEFYPDSCYAKDVEYLKSCIHAKAFHVDEIEDTWGVRVSPEDMEVQRLVKSMTGQGGLGYGQGGFRFQTVKIKDHAIVKEYSELPSKKFPEGRLIIVAGGKRLYSGKLPFMVGDDNKPGLPFKRLVCLERPGCFWGKTVLERMIPVQRRYNALRNRKAEYLNRCAIGQWTAEEDSVDKDTFEAGAASPGAIHWHAKGSMPPKMVQNPPLPNDFDEELQALLTEFSILSGVSEVSRDSTTPAGVKSGVAIGMLQEQDNTRISNTADNIERFKLQTGKMHLRLCKQFVQFPRTLHIMGKNNVAEVIDWMGTDLNSEDVILDSAPSVGESTSQKRQMVFDLLGTALLQNPDTGRMDKEMRSKVLEMIEMGEWESADDAEQLHMSKAERENKVMENGQMPVPVSFDDHVIHISRHNSNRLNVEFEELAAQNPIINQIYDDHINIHMIMMQEAVMKQIQTQMAIQPQQQEKPPQGGGQNAA